jgi:hypothetical protein
MLAAAVSNTSAAPASFRRGLLACRVFFAWFCSRVLDPLGGIRGAGR